MAARPGLYHATRNASSAFQAHIRCIEAYLRFWDLADGLRARGKAIVIITHLVFEQDRFDLLADLSGGRLIRRAAPGEESHDRR